ncbi:MAG: Gfo/Idh/MocA family oxidoreductase [Pseudomonadota bacterium]
MAGACPKRLAIVGTGRVAERHAEAILEIAPDSLAGAWNRTTKAAERFCQRFDCRHYATIDEAYADASLDAVLITTATHAHYQMARGALEAGKHVLLEKPLCETSDQIAELAALARSKGRVCMPAHNYIYAENMRRLKRHIQSGDLGRIASFWAMFNNQHAPDAGTPDMAMRELMVHHAYATLYLLGRPRDVWATASNVTFDDPAAHDQVMIVASFDDGTIANLWGNMGTDDRSSAPWSVHFKAIGTRGSGVASWDQIKFGPEPEPLWDDASYRDSFLFTDRYFLEECLGKGKAPLSTLEDALDAATIIETARKSLASGRKEKITYHST